MCTGTARQMAAPYSTMENTPMPTRMLIDASHTEETRVAVVRGNRIDEFDFEAANKKQLRGNIYLARVTRVEPSLQAAFVEYGGNRHGFLAFSEIHPDYYQIPIEDREALIAEEAANRADYDDDEAGDSAEVPEDGDDSASPEIEDAGADDTIGDAEKARSASPNRRYKMQEVIKARQILLIQVVKEERGNKGAALTTYLSLAGRHCVLMPNTARGGGVSRKIADYADRKRLKKILNELEVPDGMGCIIRTAGANRTKTEIKRDYTYLLRQWDSIREMTLSSTAPSLIHEEGNLIKRTMRDVYSSEIDEVLVEGANGYRTAKDFIKMMMPSHARKVQQYKEEIPLFHRFQVETQLESMFSTTVTLKSGGYLVINPTEALISVDVNSGRSTKERNIERTAHKTNLEAAEELARQLRLRDLAGLIVIDFIDMDESRHNRAVERKMKECLKTDRARLQVGRISAFGLMEMSRQRMRPGMLEITSNPCPVCEGSGMMRSTESSALQVLRAIEGEGIHNRGRQLRANVPTDVALYILNHKRRELGEIESRNDIIVNMVGDETLNRPHYDIRREGPSEGGSDNEPRNTKKAEDGDGGDRNERGGRRNRRNRRGKPDAEVKTAVVEEVEDSNTTDTPEDGQEEPKRRRRRGKRGGRRRRKNGADGDTDANAENAITEEAASETKVAADPGPEQPAAGTEAQPEVDPSAATLDISSDPTVESDGSTAVEEAPAAEEKAEKKPRRRRSRAKPQAKAEKTSATEEVAVEAPAAPEPVVEAVAIADTVVEETPPAKPAPAAPERPKGPAKSGWWNRPTD
jgi:ribonuclease E